MSGAKRFSQLELLPISIKCFYLKKLIANIHVRYELNWIHIRRPKFKYKLFGS